MTIFATDATVTVPALPATARPAGLCSAAPAAGNMIRLRPGPVSLSSLSSVALLALPLLTTAAALTSTWAAGLLPNEALAGGQQTEVLLSVQMYNEKGEPLAPPGADSPPAPTLARYAIGRVLLGGNQIRAEMDAGNSGEPLLMAKVCRGCSDKCPLTVPDCPGAKFCAPSYPMDFAPTSSWTATGAGCGDHDHDAGTLNGRQVCMACFGGHSHSRFSTPATGNASFAAQPRPFAVPKLRFGALVRTSPWTDRLWSNIGVGFRSAFLRQVNASTLWFSLRAPPHQSVVGLRPSLARYASLPVQRFSAEPGNRYMTARLNCGGPNGRQAGPELEYLFDTGNAGISIASDEMAAALATATGGHWNTTGGNPGNLWIDRALHPPVAITFVIGKGNDTDVGSRPINVTLAPAVWAPFPKTGQTVFERYDKNVLGLPVIMTGAFIFDDQALTVRYRPHSAN